MAYDAERRTIARLAGQGGCIFIGRCASAILHEHHPLSAFVYSDLPDRIRRVMARNALDEKSAAARIRRVDKMRRQYFDFYAGTRWGHPESYSLMLSSSQLGLEGCVEVLAAAYAAQRGGETHE